MKAFEYAAPTSTADAVKLLSVPHSAPLGGGTDLLNRMKDYVNDPERVVYLKDIKDLAGISGDAGSGLTLGAGTLLADVVGNKGIQSGYPALWQATREVGTPQTVPRAITGPFLPEEHGTADRCPGEGGAVTRIARDRLLHKTQRFSELPR